MKTAIVLSLMILAPIGHAANAAQFDTSNYSGLEAISVRPRTTTGKPFVMAIFTQEQRQRMAIAAFKKSAPYNEGLQVVSTVVSFPKEAVRQRNKAARALAARPVYRSS